MLALKTIASIGIVAGMSLAFVLGHDFITQCDYFNAKTISVTGMQRLSPEEILKQSRIYEGVNILSANIVLTRKRLLAHPWIKDADIIRKLPDEITIHCSRVPEIDGQTQRIRPDGIVSFESLGELQVAGDTPSEVAVKLGEMVSGLYTLPGDKPIDVRISSFQHKSFYVIGQVGRYGPMLYTGRDTAFDAIANARMNEMAWTTRIQVIRPSELEEVPPQVFEVNYRYMAVHGDLTKNVLLEEGDIIYVPPTPFAWVAMQLAQVLRPIAMAFQGMYYLDADPTDIGRTSASRY